MDIVAITDKGFVMPTGVMMYSVCVNNLDVDIVFHVIVDESVTQRDKDDLCNIVTNSGNGGTVHFYYISSNNFRNFPKGKPRQNITYATYYRLFLADILPQSLNKVLYLDGDIIVRHSLLQLWETNIEDNALAAVTDYDEGVMSRYELLKYSPSLGYFNAGVLLINLKYWREKEVTQAFMQYIKCNSDDIRSHDQDVLNFVFKEKKKKLHIKYNLQGGFLYKYTNYDLKFKEEVSEAIHDPVIVHYTLQKPWETPADNHPYSSTFFKYQDQTLWKGLRTDKRPLFVRYRACVVDFFRLLRIIPPRKIINKYAFFLPID